MNWDDTKYNIISKKPDFEELVKIHERIKDVKNALVGLADEDDVAQRATDLLVAISNLKTAVDELCLEEI